MISTKLRIRFFFKIATINKKKCSFNYKNPQMAFEYEQPMRVSVFKVTEMLNMKLLSV